MALERARIQQAQALARQGLCVLGIACGPGKKTGEVACSFSGSTNGDGTTRGIQSGDAVALSLASSTGVLCVLRVTLFACLLFCLFL